MENIDFIDRYIRLEMSPEERKEFENRLSTDSELSALYEETLNIKENLRYKKLNEKKAFFESLESTQATSNTSSEVKESTNSNDSGKDAKVVKFPFMKYAVAASVTLLLGFFGYQALDNSSISETDGYASIFEPENFVEYRYHENTRSISDDGQKPVDDLENGIIRNLTKDQKLAFILYDSQNFDAAIPQLKKLWENNQDSLALYYLGMSHLGKGDIETAKKYLSMPEVSKYKNPF